jgi:SH3 domain-containing protein
MIRHAAAIAVVVCLSPSWLCAQSPEFTIGAEPADVHQGPSTINPVIGKASRGAVLKVTRELGSWVRISWPAAADGVGYVHVTMGSMVNSSLPPSRQIVRAATTSITSKAGRTAPEAPPPAATGVQAQRTGPGQRTGVVAPPPPVRSVSIPHRVGLGGLMGGSTLGYGASARASVGGRFRVQLEASRYALTSAAQQRLTSVQFAPSLLYFLPDKVTDYVWMRPYVGGGVSLYRSTLSGTTATGTSVADSRMGRQVFAGAEVALAGAPRFTLSADFGYRWRQTPFDGIQLGGKGLSVSGHWYVK